MYIHTQNDNNNHNDNKNNNNDNKITLVYTREVERICLILAHMCSTVSMIHNTYHTNRDITIA